MGCGGGARHLFDLFDDYNRPRRRGCGSRYGSYESGNYGYDTRQNRDHWQNDWQERMSLLKKTYAEGFIDADEYQRFKQMIDENRMDFEDLVELRSNRLNGRNQRAESDRNMEAAPAENKYEEKLDQLEAAKQKVLQIQAKISGEIQALNQEKAKMDALAEAMLKANEAKAENFIRQKLGVEENIQNLEKRSYELENQIKEIDNMIKVAQTKKLELEALQIKEEVSKLNLDFNE